MINDILASTKRHEAILKKYPVRNKVWAVSDGSCLVAEASTFPSRADAWRDPWNRPLNQALVPTRDRDNDIMSWSGVTTVEGVPFDLIIIND